MDLADVREAGQVYVALSRAPDRDGLMRGYYIPRVTPGRPVTSAGPGRLSHTTLAGKLTMRSGAGPGQSPPPPRWG
jgi:hypothetical protein